MTSALRCSRSLSILASLTLCACADQLGIHQLVRDEDGSERPIGCISVSDDGSRNSGAGIADFDSDDDYRQRFSAEGGQAKFWFFVRPEPGAEAEQPPDGFPPIPGPGNGVPPPNFELGALALTIDIDQDHFARGARRDTFKTRDGVEHAVYTWAEADCEEIRHSLPQWVLDKVAAP